MRFPWSCVRLDFAAVTNTRPFTEAHAVAGVDVAVVFEDKLSDIDQEELRSALASVVEAEDFVAATSDDGGELAFKRRGIDGETIEELHIRGAFVHTMWHEYRGWTRTREAALRRLAPVFDRIRSGRLKALGLGMAYKDVFVNEELAKYSVFEVFRANSRFIPPMTFESDEPLWKSSINWVAAAPDNGVHTTYSSLSMEAKIESFDDSEDEDEDAEEDDSVHATEILHRQSIYRRDRNKKVDLAVEWSEDAIRGRLGLLHSQNKAVMLELLSDEMVSAIGLKE